MKQTLYVRIIAMTMGIMLLSAVIAFIITNVYYHFQLKPQNDAKITEVAKSVATEFRGESRAELNEYLQGLTNLGYQFQLRDDTGDKEQYGESFRSEEMMEADIEKVLDGKIYHGINQDPWRLHVTGFFSNELRNTIGVPIMVADESHALFVRPNTRTQFGEMRGFLAILLTLMLLLSFLFILVSTRYIVNPIKKLGKATQTIALGNYHLKLDVTRRDEIGRLADDFAKMARTLSKTEEKRQEFVSNVSHEIQSPLTSINGFSQALKEKDLPMDLREHYLSIIESESKRLSMLGKQLLTLSFLDHGVDSEDWFHFDIKEQLKEVVASLRWQWQEKELTIEIDSSSVSVYGNPSLLQQVWQNLISNAIRYTEHSGHIEVNIKEERDVVHVHVRDNGIGIPEANIPFLFERFYKVDAARVRTENSTGLGLAIAKKIVELHNGTILVRSEERKGTEFIVELKRSK